MALLVALLLFSGCGAGRHAPQERVKGVYHRVKAGETLRSIAQAYQVSLQDLAESNDMEEPERLIVDRVLFIPQAEEVIDDVLAAAAEGRLAIRGEFPATKKDRTDKEGKTPPQRDAPASRVVVEDRLHIRTSVRGTSPLASETPETKPPAAAEASPPRPIPREEQAPATRTTVRPDPREKTELKAKGKPEEASREEIQFDKRRFVWPVRGQVVARFGHQPSGMYFNGIRISAKEGTAVVAAAAGTVTYSDALKDYDETIIIRHDDHYWTVYTHLGARLGKRGDQVKQGDRIALLGKNEKGESYMSFEIRYKSKARNPLFFLP